MMQKNLYYLILIVGFVVIFGIDVFIIAFYNLNLRYAVPLGVVFVITVFRLFKTGMKYIMFSNSKAYKVLVQKKTDEKEVKRFFSELRQRLGGVSYLYIKVVLTLIMIALFMIAFRLPNTRNGYIRVDAAGTYKHIEEW